jgi:hypothetical protein
MRPPIPTPGILLLAAAVVPGTPLGTQAVEYIAVAALVVILLDGGMDIGWARSSPPGRSRSSLITCSATTGSWPA